MAEALLSLQTIKPVFVVAPTARNGITLMQRLLNSSGQIMVFGENVDLVERWPLIVHSSIQAHSKMADTLAASRQRFTRQTTEYWSSDLWPATDQYRDIATEAFCRVVQLYQQTAQEAGRPRWGIKNPMTQTGMVDRIIPLLPSARIIFLYRNLMDVLASAKARLFVKTTADVAQMARNWRDNLEVMLEHVRPQVMIIRYEDLLARQSQFIGLIEHFTEVRGIDPAVLTRKINTFQGSETKGLSPTGYIAPKPLSDEERAAAVAEAGAMMQRLGYS